MLPQVFQMLKASTAVKDIVGSNPPRIYRHGSAPPKKEGDPLVAYITWFLVSGIPENNLSDPPPVDRMSVQVDCWHPTDAGVDLLSTAARDALELFGHMTGVVINEREPETKLYRMALEFDLFTGRT